MAVWLFAGSLVGAVGAVVALATKPTGFGPKRMRIERTERTPNFSALERGVRSHLSSAQRWCSSGDGFLHGY